MHSASQSDVGLIYWQAVATFGNAAVEETVSRSEWQAHYSQLGLEEQRNNFLLPPELVSAIAQSRLCAYIFFADPDGLRLFAGRKGEQNPPFGYASLRQCSPAEALQEYGALCLFEAVDKAVGYKHIP